MNLKPIFGTLNNLKLKKIINREHVAQVGHYSFGVNYVNIRGRLGILKSINLEYIFETLIGLQIKNFSTIYL